MVIKLYLHVSIILYALQIAGLRFLVLMTEYRKTDRCQCVTLFLYTLVVYNNKVIQWVKNWPHTIF